LRRILAYPRLVGPITAWREMGALERKRRDLPQYKEIQREISRLLVTWAFYCLAFVLVLIGIGIGVQLW